MGSRTQSRCVRFHCVRYITTNQSMSTFNNLILTNSQIRGLAHKREVNTTLKGTSETCYYPYSIRSVSHLIMYALPRELGGLHIPIFPSGAFVTILTKSTNRRLQHSAIYIRTYLYRPQ